MRDVNELCSRLNKICSFLDDCFDINCGGCCYISYIIAKNLEKLNIPYSLVIYDSCFEEDDIDYYKELLINNISKRVLDEFGTGEETCSHYCIKVGDCIINSRSHDDYGISINVSSKDIHWIYSTGDWNSIYNRLLNSFINGFLKLVFDIYKFETNEEE